MEGEEKCLLEGIRLALSGEINVGIYKKKFLKKCKEKISIKMLNIKWKIKKLGNLIKIIK